jgi:hypothetical protein
MGLGALVVVVAAILLYASMKALERYLLIRLLRMVRIHVDELRELMKQEPRPLVLDVRSPIARRLDPRRLPGAVEVDIDSPEAVIVEVPPDRDVVVYCS